MSGEAINALRRAMGWAEEIETARVTRADIARREGISRARVTQIMSLLSLPPDEQSAILNGERLFSIREAIQLAGASKTSRA